jgi:hypothetical protein
MRLSLYAQSLYGKRITNSLRATEPSLNLQCSCPPGKSCSVEVNELSDRRFEVIVTRPGPVVDNEGWVALASESEARYRQEFEKRATAGRIWDSVAEIIGAPLCDPSEADL